MHAGVPWLHPGEVGDDYQVCDDLYEAVRRPVGEDWEGNFNSVAMTNANAPVVILATVAGIVDLVGS